MGVSAPRPSQEIKDRAGCIPKFMQILGARACSRYLKCPKSVFMRDRNPILSLASQFIVSVNKYFRHGPQGDSPSPVHRPENIPFNLFLRVIVRLQGLFVKH